VVSASRRRVSNQQTVIGLDMGHEGFETRHTSSIRVERAPAPHSPGSGQPTPRRHAARTALPTKRATFTTCARGQARCACWLAIGSPDPGCSRGSQGIARRRAHGCSLQQLRTERRRGPQLPQFRQGPSYGRRHVSDGQGHCPRRAPTRAVRLVPQRSVMHSGECLCGGGNDLIVWHVA
jgi:hypothetical protein